MILNSDCMDLFNNMADMSVEMIITDIPYEVVNRESNGIRNFDKKEADEEGFDLAEFLKQSVRVIRGSIYIFCSTEQVSFIRKTLIEFGLTTRLCIWEKTNPSPVNGQHVWLSGIECCIFGKKPNAVFNEFCKNSVWRFPSERSKIHPTQKPVNLFSYLIETSSNEGDLIFDPCSGSGTAAIACIRTKRDYIATEKNTLFFEKSKERIDTEMNFYQEITQILEERGCKSIEQKIPSISRNNLIVKTDPDYKYNNGFIDFQYSNQFKVFGDVRLDIVSACKLSNNIEQKKKTYTDVYKFCKEVLEVSKWGKIFTLYSDTQDNLLLYWFFDGKIEHVHQAKSEKPCLVKLYSVNKIFNKIINGNYVSRIKTNNKKSIGDRWGSAFLLMKPDELTDCEV